MKNDPKVSIVLPTYNGASKFIKVSIDSCLNQTYSNLELVIVDDCSTDETPSIIASYNDPRIKYIRNQTNQRLPSALNTGFAAATGEYLTWTSDDNFYLNTAIEKMVMALRTNSCEFVYADIYELQDNDIPGAKAVSLHDPTELKSRNCIRACFLYSRKVMEKIGGYDPDMEFIEDYDYWVRISYHFSMYHLKEPLYYYRYHPQSLWCSKNDRIRVIEFLFKLKYNFISIGSVNWFLRDRILKRYKTNNYLSRVFVKFIYKNRIQSILENFRDGRSSFTETGLKLHKIING